MGVKFSAFDAALILGYFAAVLYIGIYFARKHSSSDDYFLAGRRLGWGVIGFSLFASNISSTTLIGLAGDAYATGIAVSAYEWMAGIVLVFFSIFIAPYFLRSRIYTIPEYLERRFRPAARYYFSALTIISSVFIDTAGTLYAGALVLQFFFPQIDLYVSAIALAVVAGFYTAAGGLAAVVYTDVIQAVILLVGSAAIAILSYNAVGGWDALNAALDPGMLSLIQPTDHPTMPWTGLVFGVPVLGFYYWCTNQYIVQRILGARDLPSARGGALLASLLKIPVLYLMVFPGVMARVLFPDLEKPELAFPTLIAEMLPNGIRGLVLAGLIAAIMSSLDSTLNSASTLITIDFVQKAKPNLSDKSLSRIGRLTTLSIMVVSVAWLPVIAAAGTFFGYIQAGFSYLVPPVVAVFALGMFWKRTTGTAALVGMIGGHLAAAAAFVGQQAFGLFDTHFLHVAGINFMLSLIVVAGVSLVTKPVDPERVRENTWRREYVTRSTGEVALKPWYLDYRYQAATILMLTAIMIWLHR